MITPRPSAFAILALAACGPAAPGVREPAYEITPEAIRAHVEFLADDLLEGRGTGSRGHEIAVSYVAGVHRALDLEPGGPDGTYMAPVRLRLSSVEPARSSAAIIREDRVEPLEVFEEFFPAAPSGAASVVEAPAVFVGWGLTVPAFDYDDYRGVDVAGKIAVMLYGAPPSTEGVPRAHYSTPAVKRRIAGERGAVGMVVIPTDEFLGLAPWDEAFVADPTVPIDAMVANVNLDGNQILFRFTDILMLGNEQSTIEPHAGPLPRGPGSSWASIPCPSRTSSFGPITTRSSRGGYRPFSSWEGSRARTLRSTGWRSCSNGNGRSTTGRGMMLPRISTTRRVWTTAVLPSSWCGSWRTATSGPRGSQAASTARCSDGPDRTQMGKLQANRRLYVDVLRSMTSCFKSSAESCAACEHLRSGPAFALLHGIRTSTDTGDRFGTIQGIKQVLVRLGVVDDEFSLAVPTIDTSDPEGQTERAAYVRLSKEYDALAAQLGRTAMQMHDYRDLPAARHHEEELADPRLVENAPTCRREVCGSASVARPADMAPAAPRRQS